MRESLAETLTGFLVLLIAGMFLFSSLSQAGVGGSDASSVYGAKFDNVGGLAAGTEVRLAGVKVGTIRVVELDAELYEAKVTFTVRDDLELGDATSVRVQTDALLGGSYLGLEPGDGFGPIEACASASDVFGESGCGEIQYTQGSKDLFTLALSALGGGS